MKIKELLDSPQKWIKGAFAEDKYGSIVSPQSEEACSWCLLGAMNKCYPEEKRYKIFLKIQSSIYEKAGFLSVDRFNDHLSTSFKDIRDIIEKADV